MRILFFLVAAVVMAAWYGWFVRPSNKVLSNQIFMISGIVGVLLLLAFTRFI